MKQFVSGNSTIWGVCLGLFAMLALPMSCSSPPQGRDYSSSSSSSSGGGTSNQVCIPGQQVACACPGGFPGAQACNAEGSGYGPCQCENGTGGMGGGTAGMGGMGGGVAGMGGSLGGSGGAGGAGGMTECIIDTDCTNQGVSNFCGKPVCKTGICMRESLRPAGTPLPSQLYGDCVERQCDINGNIVAVPIDDPYDDAKVCTNDICMQGMVSHEPVALGTLCMSPTGLQGICDGNGACVQCIDGVQGCVAPFICMMNRCVGSLCNNGIKNTGEVDVDCGGSCPPCADGKTCANSTQCVSRICVAGTCAVPTCMDLVQNGKETGVDCGGADCAKCPTDEGCATPNDCQSGVCKAGVCVAPACTDAVQNGDEMGIDCGGSCPTPCP